MASWVKCEAYTEDRDSLWINLDLVATIRPFDQGSVLTFAAPDGEGQMERVVWDKPHTIFEAFRCLKDRNDKRDQPM